MASCRFNPIQSQLSGSGLSVSASWVVTDPSESQTIASGDTGYIYCKNYYQNSADRGTVDTYWGRDIYGATGIITPNFSYESAIEVAQGQTEWVDQQAQLVSGSKPTDTYRYEQTQIFYPRPPTASWNPNPMTQKGLVIV
ncbi:MAG: hypothetical protein WBZ29_09300 [Methanocella sp.]